MAGTEDEPEEYPEMNVAFVDKYRTKTVRREGSETGNKSNMERAAERRRAAGAGLVTGVAGYLTSVHVHHAVQPLDGLIWMIVGITLPLALSLTLFVIAAFLVVGTVHGSALRVGGWCLLGAIGTGVTGILIAIAQMAQGGYVADLSLVIGNVGTYGAVGGIVVGAYDARQREVSARLEGERERAKNLSTRLSVLNRVLRHDIRTNVTIIKGHADYILREEKDPKEAAAVITKQADDLHELSEEARRVETHLSGIRRRQPVDVAGEFREVVDVLEDEFPEAEIRTDLPPQAIALASPMLEEALEHLVRNGIEHNTDDPVVDIEVTNHDSGVAFTVADDGPGIPQTEIDVLDRGQETAMHHASGLGLWIAKWVIDASGGNIGLSENHPTGTRVNVTLPDGFG